MVPREISSKKIAVYLTGLLMAMVAIGISLDKMTEPYYQTLYSYTAEANDDGWGQILSMTFYANGEVPDVLYFCCAESGKIFGERKFNEEGRASFPFHLPNDLHVPTIPAGKCRTFNGCRLTTRWESIRNPKTRFDISATLIALSGINVSDHDNWPEKQAQN